MRAADAAIAYAEAAGWRIERLIAFDNPTPQARAMFSQPALAHWDRADVNGGDLGPTRNLVVRDYVKGAAVAFLDADDLFSENWLAQGLTRLRQARDEGYPRSIIHPELNWLFDGAGSVYWNPDQDDPLFAPQYFYLMNYYDSLCMVPREAHLELPYVTRDIKAGLSFQDWHFSIESMAAGWRHVSAPGTIIFKRRRDASLVTESRAAQAIVRSLEPMRVDRVAGLNVLPEPTAPPLRSRIGKALRKEGTSGAAESPPAPVDTLAALKALQARAQQETPHYGAVLQARAARAEARARPRGEDADYDLIRDHFDMAYYMAAYPDMADAERLDPVGHYIRVGEREGRNPTPLFQTAAYMARHPAQPDSEATDKTPARPAFAQWLDKDRSTGRPGCPLEGIDVLSRVLNKDPDEVMRQWEARYLDIRERLMFGDLGQQVTRAADIDPLLLEVWPEALQVKIPVLHSQPLVARLAALLGALEQADHKPARAIILVNRPRWGHARRMEGHVADALVARYGADQVLVVSTDKPGEMPEGKFPEGVRHIDFATLAEGLRPRFRQRVLTEMLRALAPEVLFNINSRLLWDTLDNFGRGLSASMRIYACLLCNEQNRYGYWTGYPLRRFYRCFDLLSGVFTDSDHLAEELRATYMLPAGDAERLQVLHSPVDKTIALATASQTTPFVPGDEAGQEPDRRPQIFWAGRLDPQKRVNLAYAIADLMPWADLRIWGEAVNGNPHALPPKPDNVVLEGRYDNFADLPLDQADLWLYTSAWDGVPQILLEVAMAGIPMVATDVGGTAEALSQDPSHGHSLAGALVPDGANPQAYVDAISARLADPAAARTMAKALREALIATRTEARYKQDIDRVLSLTMGN